MNQADAKAVLDLWTDESRKVMIGVLATSLTLIGSFTVKFPNRYPNVALIRGIWPLTKDNDHDPRSLNLVHYATKDRRTLTDQLTRLKHLAGPMCDGIQLNMIWPDPPHVQHAKKLFDRVVLQLGPSAMREVDNDPETIAKYLAPYGASITDVLIDASGGKGTDVSIPKAADVVRVIRSLYPELGVGVAGGLCEATVPGLSALVKEFPDVSIDAEGKIRDEKDYLDRAKVARYLQAFQAIL